MVGLQGRIMLMWGYRRKEETFESARCSGMKVTMEVRHCLRQQHTLSSSHLQLLRASRAVNMSASHNMSLPPALSRSLQLYMLPSRTLRGKNDILWDVPSLT